MLSSYYARSGAPGPSGPSEHTVSPAASSRLKHTKSTPALNSITPSYQSGSTHYSAGGAPSSMLLSSIPSPSPASKATPSLIDCSLPSPSFSSSVTTPSPAPDNDESFAQKMRSLLFSGTRNPAPPPIPQISYPFPSEEAKKLERELKASAARQARSLSTSGSGKAGYILDGTRKNALQPTNLDVKPQKFTSGKSFFQGGLAKAHKQLFGRSKDRRDAQDDSSGDEDQDDDMNLIYSSVMIPLDFPTVIKKKTDA